MSGAGGLASAVSRRLVVFRFCWRVNLYKVGWWFGDDAVSAATFSGAPQQVCQPIRSRQHTKLSLVVLSSVNVAGDILSLRLRAAGADDSANSYYGSSTGAQGGTTAYLSNNPATSLQLAYLSATAGRVAGDIIIRAPKEAVRTRFTHSIVGVQAGDTVSCGWVGGGFFDVATAFDAATLIGTSNIAGNYQLFGFAMPNND